MALLEICAGTVESALNAQNAGADRIELCTELSVGGLTPSKGMIEVVKELVQLPIYVLIRPRSGDFNYSSLEIEQMKEDIHFCAAMQCEGVVLGVLDEHRKINEGLTYELMQHAGFLDVTFHKAFDQTPNLFEALDTLKELGIQRVLTSGGESNVHLAHDHLGELIEEADDDLIVMPGGGLRSDNLSRLLELEAQEYHSSAIVEGIHSSPQEIKALKNMLR